MEIRIYNGKHKTWTYRDELKRMGFYFESNYWKKECEQSELTDIKNFCKRKGLKYAPISERYARNNSYRYDFFRKNKGIFKNYRWYHCAYCGKIKKKKNITVDHLIPINNVLHGKSKTWWRFVLRLKGIKDVNDTNNLVPACKQCNTRKGTKTGLWLLRGSIGKHFRFWIVYKPIRFMVITYAVWYGLQQIKPAIMPIVAMIIK